MTAHEVLMGSARGLLLAHDGQLVELARGAEEEWTPVRAIVRGMAGAEEFDRGDGRHFRAVISLSFDRGSVGTLAVGDRVRYAGEVYRIDSIPKDPLTEGLLVVEAVHIRLRAKQTASSTGATR